MTSSKDVFNALPTLSSEDLMQVKARCEFLMSKETKQQQQQQRRSPATSSKQESWWRALQYVANERFGFNLPPLAKLPAGDVRRLDDATAYIDRVCADLPNTSRTKLKRAAIERLCATILLDYLRNGEVPLNLRTVTQNSNKVAVAVEDQFPGYLENNILGLVITRQYLKQNASQ